MGAPSKQATATRTASEFDVTRLRAMIRPPRSGANVNAWTLEQIRGARDDQMRGYFARAAQLAQATRTDDALQVAFENRLAPQKCLPVAMEPAKKANTRATSIAKEGDALFGQKGIGIRPETTNDIEGDLVNHGVAFGYVVVTPREDGSRVDFTLRHWPIEFVRWDDQYQCFFARLDPQSPEAPSGDTEVETPVNARNPFGVYEVPITHADGRWVVFTEHETKPWTHGAIVPAALVWARHAYAVRDWAKGSVAHGNAKIVGELPQGVPLQDEEGALTAEAAAFVTLLQSMASDDAPVGITPSGAKVQFVYNNSTAWQVWKELSDNAEKAAARIYLGTDGTLGAQGGAPGVDITKLFGVATTRVQGDLTTIERGIYEGVIAPWCAINFGDSSLAPRRVYVRPDEDQAAVADARRARREAFDAAVKRARENGYVVDAAFLEELADEFDVPAPRLPTPAAAPTLAPIPGATPAQTPPGA